MMQTKISEHSFKRSIQRRCFTIFCWKCNGNTLNLYNIVGTIWGSQR